jgi:hypothetical protein
MSELSYKDDAYEQAFVHAPLAEGSSTLALRKSTSLPVGRSAIGTL